jgi:PleD family two-component response regulator
MARRGGGEREGLRCYSKTRLRILLVEDEPKVAKALQEGLEAESYSIAVAHTGEEGLQRVSSEPFDLAVLDVMLPGQDPQSTPVSRSCAGKRCGRCSRRHAGEFH